MSLVRDARCDDFEAPDRERFPALQLAYDALALGGDAPAVINAANEVAVAAFLQRKISYLQIVATARQTLERHSIGRGESLDEIIAVDSWARTVAGEIVDAAAG